MVNLFKRKTKKTEAAPEAAVPADEPRPADVAEATPVAAASLPEPADSSARRYDVLVIRIDETTNSSGSRRSGRTARSSCGPSCPVSIRTTTFDSPWSMGAL